MSVNDDYGVDGISIWKVTELGTENYRYVTTRTGSRTKKEIENFVRDKINTHLSVEAKLWEIVDASIPMMDWNRFAGQMN